MSTDPSHKKHNGHSEHSNGPPEFFLYTKLGQNETKNLKKAGTNKKEREVLAQIFNLKNVTGHNVSNIEVLKLDFHYINYNFCKQHAFSNEKTSTLLAMLDAILSRMIENQL